MAAPRGNALRQEQKDKERDKETGETLKGWLLGKVYTKDALARSTEKTVRFIVGPKMFAALASAGVAHYTSVISTSSVLSLLSCGRRACCLGGGGAARTGRNLPGPPSEANRGG